jgi:hypothetical protein
MIAKHLSSDYKISTMLMSQHYHLQKSLFGEIVFDDGFHTIKTTHDRISDDDDFNDAKTDKIYDVLNHILYIGVTCDTLKTRLSKYNK